jgi:cell fate (sporulation/competence/biofilm development) regulator YlbF (YheA/YmcA/DUF963 family)
MSDERTDGLEPHGEVVDGLLGLQARLRGDKKVAADRRDTKRQDSKPRSLAVVHDDVTVRLSEAVSTLQANEALSALSDRLQRLEALLDDLERGIGKIEKSLTPSRKA